MNPAPDEEDWTPVISKAQRKKHPRKSEVITVRNVKKMQWTPFVSAVAQPLEKETIDMKADTKSSTSNGTYEMKADTKSSTSTRTYQTNSSISPQIDLRRNCSSLVPLRISGELLTASGARKLLVALANHLMAAGDLRCVWYYDLHIWSNAIVPILLGRGGCPIDFKRITFEQLVEARPEYGFFGPDLSDDYEFRNKDFWRWLIDSWAPKSIADLQATTSFDNGSLRDFMPLLRYGAARRYLGLGLDVATLVRALASSAYQGLRPLIAEFDRENLWTENTMLRPCDEHLGLSAATAYRFIGGTSLKVLLRDFCNDMDGLGPVANALSWPLPFTITDSLRQMARMIGPIRYRRLCRTSFSAFQMDRVFGYRALIESTGLLAPLCDLVAAFLAGPHAQGVYHVQRASLGNWIHDADQLLKLAQMFLEAAHRAIQIPGLAGLSTYADNLLSRHADKWVNEIALEELSRVMDFTFRAQPVVTCI
jgi:hypothetical protein